MAKCALKNITKSEIASLKTVEDALRTYQSTLHDMSRFILENDGDLWDTGDSSFRQIGETLNEAVEQVEDIEMVFTLGKIKGAVDLFTAVFRSMSQMLTEQFRAKDEDLTEILMVLSNNGGFMTHGELAKKVSKSPSALTMSFKRHSYWWDYLNNRPNPDNPKSNYLVINLKGKALLSKNKYQEQEEPLWAPEMDAFGERRLSWLI